MITASDLRKRLAIRYSPPEWVLLEELRNATGFQGTQRYADAVAFSTYPSRGLQIIGFEIKVYRQDWLKELKNPDKADEISKYCDQWYIVAGDSEIVKDDELPKNWGLILPYGEKLKTVKSSIGMVAEEIKKGFLMAILRQISDNYIPKYSIQDHIDKRVKEIGDGMKANFEHQHRNLLGEYESLKSAVQEFKEKSGIQITQWNGESIGEAVKLVMQFGTNAHINRLEWLSRNIKDLQVEIDDALKRARGI